MTAFYTVLGIVAIAGFVSSFIFGLFGKPKVAVPAAVSSWYSSAPAKVFFISAAALGSMSLAMNGQGYLAYHRTLNGINEVVTALATETHQPLSEITSGEVFIRKGVGLQGDDEAVFLEPDILKGYTVHVVSLKTNGAMTSPMNPKDSDKPFFVPRGSGFQINPDISLPSILALSKLGNNDSLSASDRVAALNASVAESHYSIFTPDR